MVAIAAHVGLHDLDKTVDGPLLRAQPSRGVVLLGQPLGGSVVRGHAHQVKVRWTSRMGREEGSGTRRSICHAVCVGGSCRVRNILRCCTRQLLFCLFPLALLFALLRERHAQSTTKLRGALDLIQRQVRMTRWVGRVVVLGNADHATHGAV